MVKYLYHSIMLYDYNFKKIQNLEMKLYIRTKLLKIDLKPAIIF